VSCCDHTQEFVEPIIEDMDPENCIEEEYR
jgi:hypothetical protein